MNSRIKTKEEIRRFIVKRPFLKPSDLGAIKAGQIDMRRQAQLSWFMRGYLCAKESVPEDVN